MCFRSSFCLSLEDDGKRVKLRPEDCHSYQVKNVVLYCGSGNCGREKGRGKE